MITHCPLTGVNILRFWTTILIGFIFVFCFDFIWHGMLLADKYEATLDLWRSKEEMNSYFPWALGNQFAFVLALAFIFTRNYEAKGLSEGLRFGLSMGALLAVMSFGLYPYMPIPLCLATLWFVGTFIQVIGLGLVFSSLYRK